MSTAYEVTFTGDIFDDEEMAERYADHLRSMGHETEVVMVAVV